MHSRRPLTYLICFIRFVNCMRANHTWRSLASIISRLDANGIQGRQNRLEEEGGCAQIWPPKSGRTHIPVAIRHGSRGIEEGISLRFFFPSSLLVTLPRKIGYSSRFPDLSHMSRRRGFSTFSPHGRIAF